MKKLLFLACTALGLSAAEEKSPVATAPWREQLKVVQIPCSDGAAQPAMWYVPPGPAPKPLLVGLHTWSTHYDDAGQLAEFAQWCIEQGWVFLRPHYRGPNNTPLAMGSDRAVRDVVEAVEWAKRQAAVDASRIYVMGGSGGGHMTLQMVGRHPEIWAAASAWCPITDIAEWHREMKPHPDERFSKYARDIEAALGGDPFTDPSRRAEAWKRSPLSSLRRAAGVPLDINHGKNDLAVPFTHALRAFNAVVDPVERLDEAAIKEFHRTGRLPDGWPAPERDEIYGTSQPVFRKRVGNVRVTIFEGGHDLVYQAGLTWLAKHKK